MNGELGGDAEEWLLTGIVFGAIGVVATIVGLSLVSFACGMLAGSCMVLGWLELQPRVKTGEKGGESNG